MIGITVAGIETTKRVEERVAHAAARAPRGSSRASTGRSRTGWRTPSTSRCSCTASSVRNDEINSPNVGISQSRHRIVTGMTVYEDRACAGCRICDAACSALATWRLVSVGCVTTGGGRGRASSRSPAPGSCGRCRSMIGIIRIIRNTTIAAARPNRRKSNSSWMKRLAITLVSKLPPRHHVDDVEDLQHADRDRGEHDGDRRRICGTVIRQKTCTSVAPSRRAASSVSSGTPLIAADSSTIAKPDLSPRS